MPKRVRIKVGVGLANRYASDNSFGVSVTRKETAAATCAGSDGIRDVAKKLNLGHLERESVQRVKTLGAIEKSLNVARHG